MIQDGSIKRVEAMGHIVGMGHIDPIFVCVGCSTGKKGQIEPRNG